MQIACCLYTYFPYGGLQRDFLRIALECRKRGHQVRVYTLQWEGTLPDGIELVPVPVHSFLRGARNKKFARWVHNDLARRPVDRVVGFNKMPGLDIYYAADPCFLDRALTQRGILYRMTPRYHHHIDFEKAVFDPAAGVEILILSREQQKLYQHCYGTPAERFHLLPPGIARDRRAPADVAGVRREVRAELGFREGDQIVLQIGSGFRTKGLDRTLAAFASLPLSLLCNSRLVVIGRDHAVPFIRLARRLGIEKQLTLLPGRDDIPRFLFAADLLIHPAYNENTGTVLLEALVAGLPVLVTDVCGYAHYVREAGAGTVLGSPFRQEALNQALAAMLADPAARARWSANGLDFADRADIYSLHARAAELIVGEG
jgi:UDP-glucose:(heptosyl)LPS alpha-1,3-glucosyltransferase